MRSRLTEVKAAEINQLPKNCDVRLCADSCNYLRRVTFSLVSTASFAKSSMAHVMSMLRDPCDPCEHKIENNGWDPKTTDLAWPSGPLALVLDPALKGAGPK